MMTPQALSLAAAGAMALFLSSCGGGGDATGGQFIGGSTTSTSLRADTAEGFYAGSASNGRDFNTLVLENNQYYIVYGAIAGDAFNVTGLITGTGLSGGGMFTSADLREFPALGLPILGTLNGLYTPGARLNAVVTTRGTAVTYTGAVPAVAAYAYDTPARLSDIAGTWSMVAPTGLAVSLNIAGGGTFTGSFVGCNFTGMILAHAGARNVYDVIIRFGASPCALADQSATGHAVSYLLGNGGKRRLLVMASDATRSVATVLTGVR